MAKRTPQRLELFGGPALIRDGDPVQVSPYQAALLTVLFTEGRDRMPRSRVQALLWTDPEERSVRHRMSQLVYQVNQKTGGRVVEIVGESVHVHQGVLQCDLDDFEELIRRPDFVAAGEMMSRGFLAALPAPPTEVFEDWMGLKTLSLRARLREKALAAWAAAEAEQDWSKGRAAAETMLLLDPRDEVVLRRVMKSRAMGGSVREAEAVYLAFADRVPEGGSWVPDAETQELLETVRATYSKTDPPAEVALPPRLEVPLCGRDEELAYLTKSIFHERPRASATTVTVSGEAGLGKTRLVEEAIQGARFRGYQVLRSRPAELERNIPLNPILEALNQPWIGPILRGLEDPWRSVLLALMPQFHEGPGPLPEVPYVQPGSLPRRTYEAFFRLFQAMAESNRMLVFIDDAQWADETSAAVLQFMHRRWCQDNLTLVLTYRDEELEADQPLDRFLHELSTDPAVTGIRLADLNEESARELAQSVAADRLSDDALGEVVALAGGNPFFVIELAADYVADRGPERRGDGAPLPTSIRQMLGRRMRELDPVARQVVSALSVFGHPVSLARLTRMTAFAREECVEGLETLQRLRLVEWVDVGVGCRHDIVRRAVYEDMSGARSALLHGRIAEMLNSESCDPPKDQLALHYYRAGERELALKYALEAADGAEAGGARNLVSLLQLAYAASRGPDRTRVAARLSRALFEERRLADSIRFGAEALGNREVLDRALGLGIELETANARRLLGIETPEATLSQLAAIEANAQVLGDEELLVSALDTTLHVLDRSGDAQGASELVRRVGTLGPLTSPTARCRILAIRSLGILYGDPVGGLEAGRRAVALARSARLRRERLMTLHRLIHGFGLGGLLASEEGGIVLAEADRVSKESGDVVSQALILVNLGSWHISTGSLDTASTALDQLETLVSGTDSPSLRFLLHANRGSLHLRERRFAEADSSLEAARQSVETAVSPHQRQVFEALVGQVRVAQGALAKARDLDKGLELPNVWTADHTELFIFKALLEARVGDRGRAVSILESGMNLAHGRMPVPWLRLVAALIRLSRRKFGDRRTDLAAQAEFVATDLGLVRMAAEFSRLKDGVA